MDHQGVMVGRFQKIGPGQLTETDVRWLKPAGGLVKIDVRVMLANVKAGQWDLWRLPPEAEGVAVTYPYLGGLFIYYLHGRRLFDTLTTEDLLTAARQLGLRGVKAETRSPGVLCLMARLGFEIYAHDAEAGAWCVELKDG